MMILFINVSTTISHFQGSSALKFLRNTHSLGCGSRDIENTTLEMEILTFIFSLPKGLSLADEIKLFLLKYGVFSWRIPILLGNVHVSWFSHCSKRDSTCECRTVSFSSKTSTLSVTNSLHSGLVLQLLRKDDAALFLR